MTAEFGVGILGVGSYLPEIVRKNDWWPQSVVAKWREKAQALMPNQAPPEIELTDGVRAAMAAIGGGAHDPFFGTSERRVMPDEMLCSEMETKACRDAIDRAGIDPGDIDVVLGYSAEPDYLGTPNPCAVHRNLGLREQCLTMAIDNECNSFALQLAIAEPLIRTGRAKLALLFQSISTRVLPHDKPYSAWFGNGATAVVLGRVSAEFGILARADRTDGTNYDVVVGGVPGKRWFDEGRTVWYTRDGRRSRELILRVADNGRQVIHEALANAGMQSSQVGFYASHQATHWFRRVTQDFAGLGHARSVDTFAWTGSLSAANIPMCLAVGEREGMLAPGTVVATYSGGSGITWSSIVMRWGR